MISEEIIKPVLNMANQVKLMFKTEAEKNPEMKELLEEEVKAENGVGSWQTVRSRQIKKNVEKREDRPTKFFLKAEGMTPNDVKTTFAEKLKASTGKRL